MSEGGIKIHEEDEKRGGRKRANRELRGKKDYRE